MPPGHAELKPNRVADDYYVRNTLSIADAKMFDWVKPKFIREENGIQFCIGLLKPEVFAVIGEGVTRRVVGFCNAEPHPVDGALVRSNLAVHPDFRRRGIATTCWNCWL